VRRAKAVGRLLMPSKLPPLDIGKLTLPWPSAREEPERAKPDTSKDEPGARTWRPGNTAIRAGCGRRVVNRIFSWSFRRGHPSSSTSERVVVQFAQSALLPMSAQPEIDLVFQIVREILRYWIFRIVDVLSRGLVFWCKVPKAP